MLAAVVPLQIGGGRHAQCGGDGDGGMPRAERIVAAFGHFWETADAMVLPVAGKGIAPAGDDFMGVCLMPHIPYKPVVLEVKHIMQRDRQFDNAQVGREMTTGLGNALNQKRTDLLTELRKLISRKL